MSEAYVTKNVKILETDITRFNELYPMHGAWTWFVQTALVEFLRLHSDDLPTDEMVTLAVKSAADSLREDTDE